MAGASFNNECECESKASKNTLKIKANSPKKWPMPCTVPVTVRASKFTNFDKTFSLIKDSIACRNRASETTSQFTVKNQIKISIGGTSTSQTHSVYHIFETAARLKAKDQRKISIASASSESETTAQLKAKPKRIRPIAGTSRATATTARLKVKPPTKRLISLRSGLSETTARFKAKTLRKKATAFTGKDTRIKPKSRKDMRSRASESKAQLESDVPMTEEFSPQRWLDHIKTLWNLLIERTGVRFGVIPPHLLKEREVGHWLHLNIEELPVQYLYSDGTIIDDANENHETPKAIGTITFTAALLFNEYVKSILKDLKKHKSDACATLITLLEELSQLLKDGMFLFRNMLSHSHRPKFITSSLRQSKAFEDCVIKIEAMMSSIYFNELGLVSERYSVTEFDLLLNILGLDPKLAEKMIDIDDELVLHQSPLYFILNILESEFNNEEKVETFECTLKTRISESLLFNEQIDSSNYDFEYLDMQSPFYWAKAYLECDFSSHPLLTMLSDRPIQTEETNGCWRQKYTVSKKYSASTKSIECEVLMVAYGDQPQVTADEIKAKFELDDHTLFYHGTIRTEKVMSGLTVLKLSENQDFSHGDGFYLHESYGPAHEWAEKRRKGTSDLESTVIVYRVPNHMLKGGLDLSTDDKLWLNVIKYYRAGCQIQEGVPREVIKNKYTYIRGHICKNGYKYQEPNSHVAPKKYQYNGQLVSQYCIRGNNLLKKLSYLPVAVINIRQ